MTLVPNETEQALNRQYDVYAAAREEYRKKIAEQADEIERLRAWNAEIALNAREFVADNERLRAVIQRVYQSSTQPHIIEMTRAALEEGRT